MTAFGGDVERSLAWGVAAALVAMVALGLGWVVRKIASARTIRHLPEPGERMEHLAHVRALRRGGASLAACIDALKQRGVRAGVAQSLVLDMEREQPADVQRTRECRWGGYRFSYPGNWRLQPLVPELGESAGITIEGVGCAMFMLIGFAGDQPEMRDMVEGQVRQLRDPEMAPLHAWGPLEGEGTRYRGVHAKLRLPMELRVFRPAGTKAPFLVMDMNSLEEADLLASGFALIRDTFAPV